MTQFATAAGRGEEVSPTLSPDGPPILCEHCHERLRRDAPLISGGLTVHRDGRRVNWRGQEVHLAPTLHAILEALVAAGGAVRSYWVLMEAAGYQGDDPRLNLRQHLNRLRQALPGLPIHNEYGAGYAWRPDREA